MLTRKTLLALLVLTTAGWIYTAYGVKPPHQQQAR